MDKSVSIVIPFYNHWDLVHSLLFDLYTYNRNDISEIILVDDSSTEEIEGGIKFWQQLFGKDVSIRVVNNEYNVGFLLSANLGMKSANGDYLILISNDVRVPCSFVKDIVRILSVNKTLVGGRLLDYDTGWNKFYDKIYPYLEGWLLACKRREWDELEGFDPLFSPNDYEDVDLSTKALSMGYGLVPLNNSKIVHIGAQSIKYGSEREIGTEINQRKFEMKWVRNL